MSNYFQSIDKSQLLHIEELNANHIEIEGLYNFNYKSQNDVPMHLEHARVYAIQYQSGSIQVHGFIALPATIPQDSKLPLVLFNRGGNNFGINMQCPYPPHKLGRLTYSDAIFVLGRIAAMGYCVAASQYRGCYEEGQRDDFGGEDLLDIVNLRSMLSALPIVDISRTGIVGYSRGGMSALLIAANYDWVKTVVTIGALTDTVSWVGSTKGKGWAEMRSPLCQADRLKPSTTILLLHGKDDNRVPCDYARRFSKKLTKLSITHELVIFEGGSHYLGENDEQVACKLKSWLSKNL